MKSNYKVAVAMLAGVALGAFVVQGLHAQAKPPIFVVAEIDVSNLDAYLKGIRAARPGRDQSSRWAHSGRWPKYNSDRRDTDEARVHSTVGKG
jgi:hypothetical protein